MNGLKLILVSGLLLCLGVIHAQQTVTGTVSGPDGEPLIGVNVILTGTTVGSITDLDGNYSIDVQGANPELEFSYIGYITAREVVDARSTIDITLEVNSQVIDEVVVTALGFSANKDEMGASVSDVNTADVARSGEAMFLNALGAKASNVQISRSNGDPGAGTTIRIRGANTISGSSNPLIILDGVPISNSTVYGGGNNITGGSASGGRSGGTSQQSRLNDINPNDIESVQILKGASAAALWGSRAANGVIVITTKSGQAGKVQISYKSTYSFDVVHERYDLQDTYGQGRSGIYSATSPESWGDYIPDRAGGNDVLDQTGQYFRADDGTEYYPIDERNSRETYVDKNWDNIFQTGNFWQNDLSVSGGNDRATYFFSIGRVDQEGIVRESDYQRNNLRLNTKFRLTEWLSMSSKAGYTGTKSNRVQQNSNVTGLLLGLLRTPPDFDIEDYRGTYFDSDGVAFPDRHRSYRRYLGGSSSNPIYNNPLWTIFEQKATSDVNRFILSSEMNITPLSWLQVILRGGIDTYGDLRTYFFPIGSGSDRNSGVLAQDLISEKEVNFDGIAKALWELNSDVSFDFTVGWNFNDRQRRVNSEEVRGFLVNSDKQTTDLNTAAESSTVSNFQRNIRSNRGYGTISANLFDHIFLGASGSLEAASSVEGTFFYPAFDAAWQITNSGLVEPGNVLSFAKLRAAWGKVGVQPQPHRFETLAESGFVYSTYSDPLDISFYGGGFRIDDDKGNPDLEPEIKTEWEIGTDVRLFRDKLTLGATYYQNDIDGILLAVAQTPSSGFDTEYTNAGAMENKGFELEADYTIFQNSDWNVGLWGNFSTNENTVTNLSGTETIDLTPGASVSSRAIEGYPLGVLYGTGSQTNDNGELLLDDNGFPMTTLSPIILGDPNPDWRAGLGLRLSWKGLTMNALVEHSQGGEFSPRTLWVLRRFGTTTETANRIESTTQDLVNFAGDVIPAGSTVRGNIEDFGAGPVLLDESWYRFGIGGGFGDGQAYNFSIFDATWTRFRELSLGYTINGQGFRDKTKLSSITISAVGRNLFLIDDIPGIDPEINQFGVSNGQGLDYFTNPSTKSFLFSISINY